MKITILKIIVMKIIMMKTMKINDNKENDNNECSDNENNNDANNNNESDNYVNNYMKAMTMKVVDNDNNTTNTKLTRIGERGLGSNGTSQSSPPGIPPATESRPITGRRSGGWRASRALLRRDSGFNERLG